jgi:hypothetical protein
MKQDAGTVEEGYHKTDNESSIFRQTQPYAVRMKESDAQEDGSIWKPTKERTTHPRVSRVTDNLTVREATMTEQANWDWILTKEGVCIYVAALLPEVVIG